MPELAPSLCSPGVCAPVEDPKTADYNQRTRALYGTAFQLSQPIPLLLAQLPNLLGFGQQIGPALCTQRQTLLAAPNGNARMVAAQQHIRHSLTAPVLRSCVMGAVQQSAYIGMEAVLHMALRIVQNFRLQTQDRIQKSRRRNLSAREHKVTKADLAIHVCIHKALIHPLITPA